MKQDSRLLSIIFVPDRQWSGKKFLLFLCLYSIVILWLALPDGSETLMSLGSRPNPECADKFVNEAEVIKCDPTLRLYAHSTANDYLVFFGDADPASYIRGGLLLAGKELNDTSSDSASKPDTSILKRLYDMNVNGYGMWPPGMFFLNALPLSVSSELPLGLYHVVVASILWAVAFALLASVLVLRMRLWVALILPLSVVPFPLFHDYLIRYGVMYSETYGAALMIIGFTLLFMALYRKPGNIMMIAAGATFAIASFIRSQMLPVSIGVSLILIVNHLIQKQRIRNNNASSNYSLRSIALIVFLVGFYLPIGSYMAFNRGALFHGDYMWEYPFKIPAYPDAGAANFTALGGIRAACEVDIEKCNNLHEKIKLDGQLPGAKAEVLKAFLSHPIRFSIYKLPIAWRYWIEDNGASGFINYRIDNIFISILFVTCLIYMVVRKLWFIFWVTMSAVALFFGPPFLLHFETRYFYLTKVFLLFLPIWLLFIKSPKETES